MYAIHRISFKYKYYSYFANKKTEPQSTSVMSKITESEFKWKSVRYQSLCSYSMSSASWWPLLFLLKSHSLRENWIGGRGAHLSMDTSGIHLQIQKCVQNTSWEPTGVPDQRIRIYRTTQNSVGRRNYGENKSVSRTGLALGGWGPWSRGPIPTSG